MLFPLLGAAVSVGVAGLTGWQLYEALFGGESDGGAGARTATSAGINALMDKYFLEEPTRQSRDIDRVMGEQRSMGRMSEAMELAFQDPLTKRTGLAQSEIDRIAALAYTPGPSPLEVMTHFGVR